MDGKERAHAESEKHFEKIDYVEKLVDNLSNKVRNFSKDELFAITRHLYEAQLMNLNCDDVKELYEAEKKHFALLGLDLRERSKPSYGDDEKCEEAPMAKSVGMASTRPLVKGSP